MPRRLFTLASALSLAVCLTVCVLWVRSYWRSDAWNWGTRSGRAGVASLQGRLSVGWLVVPPAGLVRIPRGQIVESVPADEAARTAVKPGWSFAMVQATRVRQPGLTYQEVRVPYWLLAMAAGVLPAIWVRRGSRGGRLLLRGLCPACGDDLRATPEKSGALLDRCPECGATPGASIPA